MRQRGPYPKAKAGGGEVALPMRARLCNALSTRQTVSVELQRSKGSPLVSLMAGIVYVGVSLPTVFKSWGNRT